MLNESIPSSLRSMIFSSVLIRRAGKIILYPIEFSQTCNEKSMQGMIEFNRQAIRRKEADIKASIPNHDGNYTRMKSIQFRKTFEIRGFLSFTDTDKTLAHSFKRDLERAFPNLEILDHPVKEKYEKDWKSHCEKKISKSSFLICLIGNRTRNSAAVKWEIGKGLALGKFIIAINMTENSSSMPEFLKRNSVVHIEADSGEIFSILDSIFHLSTV